MHQFYGNDEKSSVELQISMNLAQELLSYIELGYNGYRAPNGPTKVLYIKTVFFSKESTLAEIGRNWQKNGF